jgi:hypothetical protein
MGGAKAERESSTAPGEQHNTAIIGTHRLAASRASSFGAFFFWLADRNRAVSVFFAIFEEEDGPSLSARRSKDAISLWKAGRAGT